MEAQPMTKQEKQRLYSKKYWEANREAILKRKAEYCKVMYSCKRGQVVRRNNLSDHLKTKKHLRLLQEQQEVVKDEDVVYVDTVEEVSVKVKEEAIQGESVEEPLLEITEEAVSVLQRLLTLFRR